MTHCATVVTNVSQVCRERELKVELGLKTLIVKDSNVRSIWAYLTASSCYTTNTTLISTTILQTNTISTNNQLGETDRRTDRQTDRGDLFKLSIKQWSARPLKLEILTDESSGTRQIG